MGAKPAVKILVAEGNRLLADALGDLFAELTGGLPVICTHTIGETLEAAARERPDLVLIDHWIGRESAEATVREMLRRSPKSSIIVLTTGADERIAARMRSAGAKGCVEKGELTATAQAIVESVYRP